MHTLLQEIMSNPENRSNNAGYGTLMGFNPLAILYECVSTIASVYPVTSLLESATKSIAVFLESTDPNIKYLGRR